MLRQIADLKENLAATADEIQRGDLARLLHNKQLALTIAFEKRKRRR